MVNMTLTFPVFSNDTRLGEMADFCVYRLPEDQWQKEKAVPTSFMNSMRALGDSIAADSSSGRCSSSPSLPVWRSIISRWAKGKGFLGPRSSSTGRDMAHFALVASAASLLKVRTHLDQATRKLATDYVRQLDKFVERDPDIMYNNHYIWKQAARFLAGVVLNNERQALTHVAELLKYLELQVKPEGYITSEKRCTRTLHYQVYYLEPAFITLSTLKMWKPSLYQRHAQKKFDGVLRARIQKVFDNLARPDRVKLFAGFYKYRTITTMFEPTGVPRLQALMAFLSDPRATRVPRDAGNTRWAGHLTNLQFS